MGASTSRNDYIWVFTPEPHASRRKEILAKHPEVKSLMGHDPSFKWVAGAMVLAQIVLAYLSKDVSNSVFILMAYLFSGTLNHSLTLAMHEVSHNTAFGHSRPILNRLFGIFVNLPIGLPASVTFKKYHLDHHKYQGDDYLDTDIPMKIECRFVTNTVTKFLWVVFQPLFYSTRPFFIQYKRITGWEVVNFFIQLAFDATIFQVFGARSLLYLLLGSVLGMGVHPISGHFVSEHYMFVKGYETYSYYGPLNWLTFNVGYHNEHHDFPNIPGSRLPQLKAMCPEFYDDLPHHTSWVKVLVDFVTDPSLSPYSRVKRESKFREKEAATDKIYGPKDSLFANGKVD